MGKKDKDFKFIVGKQGERSSKVWSVKVRKSDVYIMNAQGKQHKISLHKSGVCHSAVTKESCEHFGMTPEQRTSVRWKLSLEDYESAVAFSLIFHYDQLQSCENSQGVIQEIPMPPINAAAVVQFVKTKANNKDVAYELADGLHLLRSIKLDADYVLTVIYYYTNQFNSLVKSCEEKIHKTLESRMPPKPLIPNGGFVTVFDKKGQAYYVEISLTSSQ